MRDGVEDFTLMHSLKLAADAADKAGTQKELVKKARILLGEKATSIGKLTTENNFKVTVIGKYGEAGARKIADQRLDAINAVRLEIAGLLSQLKK